MGPSVDSALATRSSSIVASYQLTWKCKKALSKSKVVFLQGSVHFHVSWWEGSTCSFCSCFGSHNGYLLEPAFGTCEATDINCSHGRRIVCCFCHGLHEKKAHLRAGSAGAPECSGALRAAEIFVFWAPWNGWGNQSVGSGRSSGCMASGGCYKATRSGGAVVGLGCEAFQGFKDALSIRRNHSNFATCSTFHCFVAECGWVHLQNGYVSKFVLLFSL